MLSAGHTISGMWPWEAFNWGVFWAILAAGATCVSAVSLLGILASLGGWLLEELAVATRPLWRIARKLTPRNATAEEIANIHQRPHTPLSRTKKIIGWTIVAMGVGLVMWTVVASK
jgi:hypothetical protein